jgi:hypothetical protein
MKLLRTTLWAWYDIAFLKWSVFLFGAAAGACFSESIKPCLPLCLALAVIFAVRPAFVYFRGDGKGD